MGDLAKTTVTAFDLHPSETRPKAYTLALKCFASTSTRSVASRFKFKSSRAWLAAASDTANTESAPMSSANALPSTPVISPTACGIMCGGTRP